MSVTEAAEAIFTLSDWRTGTLQNCQSNCNPNRGFTLVELLVVIAIIAIVAAILFPVFASSKASAKGASCLSNMRQISLATDLYNADHDSAFPQTRLSSSDPWIADASGSLEEPDFGSSFDRLAPYLTSKDLQICPSSSDPRGAACDGQFPDHAELGAYIVNASTIFGLNESEVSTPTNFIIYAERRSHRSDQGEYCNYAYRPWFSSLNPVAPEDDMDNRFGAIEAQLHFEKSHYAFADGHVKSLAVTQTFTSGGNVNLHRP